MKLRNIIFTIAVMVGTMYLAACTKNFGEINTDPNANNSAPTEPLFAHAIFNAHSNSFEAYYDFYRQINPWMQLWTENGGNGATLTKEAGNGNNRYGQFYGAIGNYLTDIHHIISLKPESERAGYVYEDAISQIPKIRYAFYVSDINGDIAYTEAFQARYGGISQPAYDHQDSLFILWDQQLKDIIQTLKTTQPVTQKSFGSSDLIYQGDVNKWIVAATTLRLKIAMRLTKRDPDYVKKIANEVIASGDLMKDNSDSWIFVGGPGFTEHGNWNPLGFQAPKPMVDFMWNTGDPRIGLYFQKNDFSKENFQAGQAQGKIPGSSVWNPRQYVGQVCSPDEVNTTYGKSLQPHITIKDSKGQDLTLDTVSLVQYRLFRADQADADGTPGTGFTSFPVLTYADVCFMRAELAVRGFTTDDPATWYQNGIKASIDMYNTMASTAKVYGYSDVKPTDQQIQDYLNDPQIKYNPAKGLEQIAVQAFLNFYRQPNEAWALYKRTGMPNANTMLPHVDFVAGGTVEAIPRRAPFNIAIKGQANYDNIMAAQQHMAQDPDWGNGPSDIHGRVWWDKK